MEPKSVYALIVLFVSNTIAILSNFQERLGDFRVLHKHPGIRRCGSIALKQNDLVGGRVKHASGVCEGLSHHWGLNQTIQSGYAYVKIIHVQDNYHLPVKLKTKGTRSSWGIPGVIRNGAKLEVTLTMPTQFELSTYTGEVSLKNKLNGSVSDEGGLGLFPQFFKFNVETKFLFLAKTSNTLAISVDKKRILNQNIELENMRQIIIERTDENEASNNQLLVHRFEFTEG